MSDPTLFATSQVLDSRIQIPSPPTLLGELNTLLDAADVNLKKVAELLARDAGITALLFKLAASPAFGGRKAPDSVDQVISLLGLGTVADLVRGLLLRASLYGDSAFYAWFWERSDDIARIAGAVAAERRSVTRLPPGHVQLAALFHDCGVPILAGRFPEYIDFFRHGAGHNYVWPRVKETDARFNTSHAVVGNMVAKHWKLPDYVCEAVRLHHDTAIKERRVAMLVAILQLAAHLYNLHGMKDDTGWEDNRDAALAALDMNEQDLLDMEEDLG